MSDQQDNSKGNLVNFEFELKDKTHENKVLNEDSNDLDSIARLLETVQPSSVSEEHYGRNKIKRAGRILRKREGNIKEALQVVHYFRYKHQKPLNSIEKLISNLCESEELNATSYRRLKRLASISDKLRRPTLDGKKNNSICITNMQDIAGCRFIFPNMQELTAAKSKIVSSANVFKRIKLNEQKNYIQTPKINDCGYRSIHLIFNYKCREGKSYLIEVQLRTYLQNTWATAVEIIDIINNSSIKTSSFISDHNKSYEQIKWENILELMSKYIAHTEKTNVLSDNNINNIARKLEVLNNDINAIKKLRSFNMLTTKKLLPTNKNGIKDDYVLFIIDTESQHIELIEALGSDKDTATAKLQTAETTYAGDKRKNILLISTKDTSSLERNYPNYYGSSEEFIKLIREAISLSQSNP